MVFDNETTICDGIDLHFMDDSASEGEDEWIRSSPVKYFTNELSFRGRLKRLLLRKPKARFGSRIIDLVAKLLLCVLYMIRIQFDDVPEYQCLGRRCNATFNETTPKDNDNMVFSSSAINWYVLVWVQRPLPVWLLQVLLSAFTFVKSILHLYITSKGTCFEKATRDGFVLEVICSVPIIVTVCYPPILRNLYFPVFLNCWLVRRALEKLFNDLHLTKQRFQTISVTLSQQLFILVVTLICLIFTTICGIQHIQRGSAGKELSMFESFYFVIVTFSTVGYGDISPDTWLGQLFMTLMICAAFAFIPRQIEGITSTWKERKKTGGEYSKRHSSGRRHVVVCSSNLLSETMMDFLIEFYAHPKLEDHIVVILSSEEKDDSLQMILKDPKWAHRVIYMRGSALKDIDLQRCRLNEADACFILAPSKYTSRDEADQHTILRSWAVKDFASKCRQYIQLFKTEYKIHVKFAEHVVCEDEFKYALLANNCLYPGLSTLVTLLLHSTTGEPGLIGQEPWQQVYGRHAGNEVYHIQLSKSIFFSSYSGCSFMQASTEAHRRFGVCLVAVLDMTSEEPKLLLNPGNNYILQGTDYCFYIGEFKEEYSKISEAVAEKKPNLKHKNENKNIEAISGVLERLLQEELQMDDDQEESVFNSTITSQIGQEIARRLNARRASQPDRSPTDISSELNILDFNGDMQTDSSATPKVLQMYKDMGQEEITTGAPPLALYVGSRRTQCHLVKSPRPNCCVKWGEDCQHCTYKNARDERWKKQLIILAAENACAGIYNFIVPLRSHFISMNLLSPIILLLEDEPDSLFLENIGHFPMVYWMRGNITSLDDLLLAGIHKVSHLVIVNKEPKHDDHLEETMSDSKTIVATQTILRLFPNTNIITELSQASNIRFMHFQANQEYTRQVSKLEKKIRERMSSTMSHIFRLPFAAGQVFSASMLDTLLYQTFVKGYLITFVRLLLGIDAEENSGHLSSIRVKTTTIAKYPTYGELYEGMASTTGEIPIAIYRTEKSPDLSSQSSSNNNNNTRKWPFTKKIPKTSVTSIHVKASRMENSDLAELVRSRLVSLGMKTDDYVAVEENLDELSYVILNPTPKRKLRVGDYIYVIQPSSMSAIPSKQGWTKTVYHQRLARQRSTESATSPKLKPRRIQKTQVNGKQSVLTNKDVEMVHADRNKQSLPTSTDLEITHDVKNKQSVLTNKDVELAHNDKNKQSVLTNKDVKIAHVDKNKQSIPTIQVVEITDNDKNKPVELSEDKKTSLDDEGASISVGKCGNEKIRRTSRFTVSPSIENVDLLILEDASPSIENVDLLISEDALSSKENDLLILEDI